MKSCCTLLMLCIMFLWGCTLSLSPVGDSSPVGEWHLYVITNGKFEKMRTPEVIMTIRDNGTFSSTAKESRKDECNEGTWKREGRKIIFTDRSGRHEMVMEGSDRLSAEEQPFEKNGIKLIYLRSGSDSSTNRVQK